jgi:hypothetical protein
MTFRNFRFYAKNAAMEIGAFCHLNELTQPLLRQGIAMTKIKERPILFSAPMVRAILEGRKTVTRRPVRGLALKWLSDFTPEYVADPANNLCPYGRPGDRLWVRETLEVVAAWGVYYAASGPNSPEGYLDDNDVRGIPLLERYGDPYDANRARKIPAIHMPRWACRIVPEIADIRIERLQDGEGDTAHDSRYLAEGINQIHHGDGQHYYHAFKHEPGPGNWVDPFDAWRELWVEVNGADSWNANPWVWVVEFKRVAP